MNDPSLGNIMEFNIKRMLEVRCRDFVDQSLCTEREFYHLVQKACIDRKDGTEGMPTYRDYLEAKNND